MRVHREDHVLAQHGLVALADLRELDHRHPDRVAGDVAELEAAVEEALGDRAVDVVRGRAVAEGVRAPRRSTPRRPPSSRCDSSLGSPGQIARETSTQCPPGPGDLERGQHHVGRARRGRVPAILNSGSAEPFSPDEHHVHRLAAAALARRSTPRTAPGSRARVRPGRERLEEDPEALGVDPDAVADRLELEVALDGARVVERRRPTATSSTAGASAR